MLAALGPLLLGSTAAIPVEVGHACSSGPIVARF